MLDKTRSQIRKKLNRWIERRAERKIKNHPALNAYLKHYGRTSKSTGASYADYLALYTYIRKHKPREVLECGTGFTTVVMAQALQENKDELGIDWHLVSMEEGEGYYRTAIESLPPTLRENPRLQIVRSPAVEDTHEVFRGIRYADIPERPYDFVYVDGPDYVVPRPSYLLPYDMDFLRIAEKSDHPVSAFIDTRTDTSYMYSLLFPRAFVYDYIRGIGIVKSVTKKDVTHDLIKGKHLVARTLARRHMRSPSVVELLFGHH